MSLIVMSKPESAEARKAETLRVSDLESLFVNVEPEEKGEESSRTIIGRVGNQGLARIIRKAKLLPDSERRERQETAHYQYHVYLAFPHDIHPEIIYICSSVWNVSPTAALEPEVIAESKPDEKFATYPSSLHPPIEKPEDIFEWYDTKAEKLTPNVTPNISPSIYTEEGMKDLVKKFRRIDTNGEA